MGQGSLLKHLPAGQGLHTLAFISGIEVPLWMSQGPVGTWATLHWNVLNSLSYHETSKYCSLEDMCVCTCAKPFQSYPTLCEPMDCSQARLLCSWDIPGKNTGVGCCFLPQGSFLTQGLNLCLLHLPALADGFFLPLIPLTRHKLIKKWNKQVLERRRTTAIKGPKSKGTRLTLGGLP